MPNGYLAAVNPNVALPSALPVRAVATSFLRLRPLIVTPLMLAMMALSASSGAPRAQLAALAAVGLPVLAFFVAESIQGRRRVFSEGELFRSLFVTVLGIGGVALVTGGASSPSLPMLLAPTGIGFAAFGRDARATRLLLVAAAVLVALSLAPAPLPPLPEPSRYALIALAVLDAMLLLRVGVAGLSDAHARAATSALLAGEELVLATRGRSQALEALGAKVAHEVKNPLAAVRALVEVMLEGATGRDRQRLEVASSEVARIESILAGYLSWRHPFAEIVRAPTRVDEVARGLLLVLEARAAALGIALEGEGEPGLSVSLDAARLREGLLNLLLNAIEALPRGGRITVRWRYGDDRLRLTVADDGRGMDAATLAKIGTPFFTTRQGGTGLGVALARQVAEQHGGELTFESVPSRGTEATLSLPCPRS